MPHSRLNLLILLLLVSCGAELSSGDPTDPNDPNDPTDPNETAGSAWSQPVPPTCPQMITGSGAVWLDDPADMSLVQRPLHCLAGTSRLEGQFIVGIQPKDWQSAYSEQESFVYTLDDQHLHEVQLYYAIVGMVGYYQPHMTLAELPPIQIDIRHTASFATSRYDLPNNLSVGLQGVIPQMLSVQITSHEYAHHLIMRHLSDLDQILNEGLADYLAADFTKNPLILSLDRMDLPDALRADAEAMAIAARYLERSVDNELTYPDDAVSQRQLCQTLREAEAAFPPDTPLVPSAKLERCDSMSADEQAQLEPHRTGMILAGALWELRQELGSGTVNALIFRALADQSGWLDLQEFAPELQRADQALHQGANAQSIEQVFSGRGLL